MNSTSIVNFAGKGVEQMTWTDVLALYKQVEMIGSHRNMSDSELNYEIGGSRQCLVNHAIPTTTFAYPFENGNDNVTVVKKVSQDYTYARSGNYPLMFLTCDHFSKTAGQLVGGLTVGHIYLAVRLLTQTDTLLLVGAMIMIE